MRIRANVYFAGCGLVEIGLGRAGVEVQQSFEIDGPCVTTQRRNFSHEVVQCRCKASFGCHSGGIA